MTDRKLKIVGWGFEGDEISSEEHEMITSRYRERFTGDFEIRKAPTEDSIEVHAPRLEVHWPGCTQSWNTPAEWALQSPSGTRS